MTTGPWSPQRWNYCTSRRELLLGAAAAVAWCALGGATPAAAETVAPKLSAKDEAILTRVETYLNGIRSFKSRFIQVSQNGGIAEGNIFIQRPGKMRIEYKPPVPILVVATGKLLILYDRELDQTTHLPLGTSPAAFLLEDNVELREKVNVTKVRSAEGRIHVSVVERKSPDKGELHLTFLDNPLKLREWVVVDAQRQQTKVVLIDPQEGVKLDPSLFLFERVPLRPAPGSQR